MMDVYNPFTMDVFEMTRAKNWPAPINYVEVSEVPVLLREEIRFKNNSTRRLDFRLIFKSPEGAREITIPNPEGITTEKELDFRIYVTSDLIHETACKVMKGVHYNMYIATKEYDDANNFVAYHERLLTSIVFRDAKDEYEMGIATPSESQQPGPSQREQPNSGTISARKRNAEGNEGGSENSKKRAMDCERKLMKGDGYSKWRIKNIYYKATSGGLFDVKWSDEKREEKDCIQWKKLYKAVGKAKKEIAKQMGEYKPRNQNESPPKPKDWNLFNTVLSSSKAEIFINLKHSFERIYTKMEELKHRVSDEARIMIMKIVDQYLDKLANEYGYCCAGRKFLFLDSYGCAGQESCRIREREVYHEQWEHGKPGGDVYCQKHFTERVKERIENQKLREKVHVRWTVHRHDNHVEEHKFKCVGCGKWAHPVCARFPITSKMHFVCGMCETPTLKVTTDVFQKSKLAEHMQNSLEIFLMEIDSDSFTEIHLMASGKCDGKVPEGEMRHWFDKINADLEHPFIYKNIGMFQIHEGEDILVFDMMVHEFVEGTKKGTTHLYYMDTNNHFVPTKFKGEAYQRTIAAYWAYARSIGFERIYIYASAPPHGDGYLFYGHPPEQMYLTDDKLQDWYMRTIGRGLQDDIIVGDNQTFEKLVSGRTNGELVNELYFDGGLWPDLIEQFVNETEPRRRNYDFKRFIRSKSVQCQKRMFLYNLDKVKDNILDEDELQSAEIASCRDNWMNFQARHQLQFDTMRSAKYATLIILLHFKELRNQREDDDFQRKFVNMRI
ncbi:hypothetical protein B9Z55_024863 [Caenorhabditis nigoni]|uniref:histone acetyltransferase n=1 Tax=Caenorhabditis nigoni TaxID=1611254 RepID=A0A2G5SVU4_9PELO|nr:hypothetical protein B9Z55_024863 [Caenorhabditis nigoni]